MVDRIQKQGLDPAINTGSQDIQWDFETVFNDGVELRSGYGTRNTHGNKAVDFSRASGTGSINKSGVVDALAVDEPSIVKGGLEVYESYSNYLSNPIAPVTQVATIPSGNYTLWCLGVGSATTSYGTATEGNPLSFTSAGEALTVTVTGALDLFNLIDLNKIAPPIVAASAPSPRSPDICSVPMMGNMPPAGQPFTIEMDVTLTDWNGTNRVALRSENSATSGFTIVVGSSGLLFGLNNGSTLVFSNAFSIGTLPYRVTADYNGTSIGLSVNGSPVGDRKSFTTPPVYNLNSDIYIGSQVDTNYLNAPIKALRIAHKALTADQIAARGGYQS